MPRDHMTDLELIFTMLGERVTTEISQQEKPDSGLTPYYLDKINYKV